ncbi:MAG: cytochrome P450 [Dehalococcoidia bacterium]|nr:cytochrome P450 [Dehalococcoidia bacterium]
MTSPDPSPVDPALLAQMFTPDFVRDPYPVLDALRELVPAITEPVLGRTLLTRYGDVDTALKERSYSRDPHNAAADTLMARLRGSDEAPGTSILFMDPPDHTRLRGLVSKAFTPRAVEAIRPRIAEIANELLDAVEGQAEWDLIRAFAAPLPTVVIAEMLGVDPSRRAEFKAWSDELVKGLNPFISEEDAKLRDAAREALAAFFAAEIAKRRETPRDDLLSALVEAEDEGHRLTEAELIGTCTLLLVAGNVTTTDLIGNGMNALLRHRDQVALLAAEPDRIANAVEEMLRFDTPVVMTGRIVMADEVVGGCPVAKGHSLSPMLAAANHDPRLHHDPDRFDITRDDTDHVSFGGGIHYCLGAPLARAEAQEGIKVLLARFPHLDLAGEGERRLLPGFRGFVSLPVRA